MRTKHFSIISNGNKLKGIIFNAGVVKPTKTVIVSHGFASNMMITAPYAKIFEDAGYVVILFDFCMSGSGISGGKSKNMSVLTQCQNLMDVLDYARNLDIVDKNHITLCGCSQGGLVSALTAAEREHDIEQLIMYYPALCIPDDARRGCLIGTKIDVNHIPDEFFGLFVKLGKKYIMDAQSLDPYEQICTFKKPVLIIHGIEDKLVDISYSRKAGEKYSNAQLIEVHGDHGFITKGFHAAKKATIQYLKNN